MAPSQLCQDGSERSVEVLARERFEQTCDLTNIAAHQRDSIWSAIRNAYGAANSPCTFEHVLGAFEFVHKAKKAGYVIIDPVAVEWAVWMHNAADSSKQASAALATELLKECHLSSFTMQNLQRYILASEEHKHLPGDPDSEIVLDALLSVLGTGFRDYVQYAAHLRQASLQMDECEYVDRRCRKVKSFLDREHMYYTDIGQALLERQARNNLQYEWKLNYAGSLIQSHHLDELAAEQE